MHGVLFLVRPVARREFAFLRRLENGGRLQDLHLDEIGIKLPCTSAWLVFTREQSFLERGEHAYDSTRQLGRDIVGVDQLIVLIVRFQDSGLITSSDHGT